jgi:hypothetical protein
VADIKEQIRSGEIPPLKGDWMMNSTAVFSHATGDAGRVGYALQRRLGDLGVIFYLSFFNIANPVQANYI